MFAVGDQAFLGMRESKQDQCIVISGESGSGKTVAANEIIRYLMQLTNQGDPSSLELMIAHTSPILEVCLQIKNGFACLTEQLIGYLSS